jgi:hypothetical protein
MGAFGIEIRGEAFHLANHVDLGMPNASFLAGSNGANTSSTFGTITSALAPRTQQLGAKVNF